MNLAGDKGNIRIGANTSVQDCASVTVDGSKGDAVLGNNVVLGA